MPHPTQDCTLYTCTQSSTPTAATQRYSCLARCSGSLIHQFCNIHQVRATLALFDQTRNITPSFYLKIKAVWCRQTCTISHCLIRVNRFAQLLSAKHLWQVCLDLRNAASIQELTPRAHNGKQAHKPWWSTDKNNLRYVVVFEFGIC